MGNKQIFDQWESCSDVSGLSLDAYYSSMMVGGFSDVSVMLHQLGLDYDEIVSSGDVKVNSELLEIDQLSREITSLIEVFIKDCLLVSGEVDLGLDRFNLEGEKLRGEIVSIYEKKLLHFSKIRELMEGSNDISTH